MNDKSCGNCIQCDKYYVNGIEKWACENYDNGCGMPFDVFPPKDEACSNWSDDPNDKDKPQDKLRYFIDHFWNEVDD